MVEEGDNVYFVIADETYSATEVELLGKTDSPEWADEMVWEGRVTNTGSHYKRGEVIFAKKGEVYSNKEAVENFGSTLSEDLEYNSE